MVSRFSLVEEVLAQCYKTGRNKLLYACIILSLYLAYHINSRIVSLDNMVLL
jgi:hypothetical protein